MAAFPDGGACAGQRLGVAHRFDDVARDALAGSGQLAKEVAGVGGGQGLVTHDVPGKVSDSDLVAALTAPDVGQ